MTFNKLFHDFAVSYVDEHESEIWEAVLGAIEVDLDEVASAIAENIVDSDLYEAIANEVFNRM